eukprot:365567-Chlamydomonas_euryale.AAC.8
MHMQPTCMRACGWAAREGLLLWGERHALASSMSVRACANMAARVHGQILLHVCMVRHGCMCTWEVMAACMGVLCMHICRCADAR